MGKGSSETDVLLSKTNGLLQQAASPDEGQE